MFELHSVSKSFELSRQQRRIFHDVSFSCRTGSRCVITGASGAGKSTLLLLMSGIEEPSSGSIRYRGKAVPRMGSREHEAFLCSAIGLMFQFPYLIPEFSVLENVIIKGMAAGMSRAACHEQGRKLLAEVGLSEMADRSPSLLSGGEQQRVALVRALFLQPMFLIADEPTAHLDAANAELIFALMARYQDAGMGMVVTSHDPRALHGADQVFLLSGGKLWQNS